MKFDRIGLSLAIVFGLMPATFLMAEKKPQTNLSCEKITAALAGIIAYDATELSASDAQTILDSIRSKGGGGLTPLELEFLKDVRQELSGVRLDLHANFNGSRKRSDFRNTHLERLFEAYLEDIGVDVTQLVAPIKRDGVGEDEIVAGPGILLTPARESEYKPSARIPNIDSSDWNRAPIVAAKEHLAKALKNFAHQDRLALIGVASYLHGAQSLDSESSKDGIQMEFNKKLKFAAWPIAKLFHAARKVLDSDEQAQDATYYFLLSLDAALNLKSDSGPSDPLLSRRAEMLNLGNALDLMSDREFHFRQAISRLSENERYLVGQQLFVGQAQGFKLLFSERSFRKIYQAVRRTTSSHQEAVSYLQRRFNVDPRDERDSFMFKNAIESIDLDSPLVRLLRSSRRVTVTTAVALSLLWGLSTTSDYLHTRGYVPWAPDFGSQWNATTRFFDGTSGRLINPQIDRHLPPFLENLSLGRLLIDNFRRSPRN